MLSDDLQNLRDVDVDAIAVPPFFLTVVTREEQNLCSVREDVFYLYHVRLSALGAVHFVSTLGRGDIVSRVGR